MVVYLFRKEKKLFVLQMNRVKEELLNFIMEITITKVHELFDIQHMKHVCFALRQMEDKKVIQLPICR